MTVKELREQLSSYPDDMDVSVLTAYNIFCIAEGELNSIRPDARPKNNKLYLEYRNPLEEWNTD